MTDSSDINPPLLVRGARILDPASGTDTVADVHVCDGRIAAIGEAPPGAQPAQTIDAAGLWLLPGVIDLAAHLRERGSRTRRPSNPSRVRRRPQGSPQCAYPRTPAPSSIP